MVGDIGLLPGDPFPPSDGLLGFDLGSMEYLWCYVLVASDINAMRRQKVFEMLLAYVPSNLLEPKVSVSTHFAVVSTNVGSIDGEVTDGAL